MASLFPVPVLLALLWDDFSETVTYIMANGLTIGLAAKMVQFFSLKAAFFLYNVSA